CDGYKLSRTYSLLALGRFVEGWEAFSHRSERIRYRAVLPGTVALNDGEPLDGKRVALLASFGIGDEVRFASCYRDVLRRAAEVKIVCEPRLVTIFERSFPQAVVRGHRRSFACDATRDPRDETNYEIVTQQLLDELAPIDECC